MPLALLISPIRSWPLDQGNRARIAAMGTMLRERGYEVHFLLSGLEGGPAPGDLAAMEGQWDLLRYLPYRHLQRQSHAEAWGADDWYDPALNAEIADLCRTWDYDLCLVNYAWYSAALDALPPATIRLIDTHDAFGERQRRLYAAGTTPAWYYTRAEDEGRCLDRADLVLAFRDEETAWFAALTDQPVRTIGHVMPLRFLPPQRRAGRLRGGYMASGNPSNLISIRALIRHWAEDAFLSQSAELHIAGPICAELGRVPGFVIRHGVVADPQAFFGVIDFAVNPDLGGPGLKIKSVEALAYGQPLFATTEGMLGISGAEAPYVMPDVARMTQALSQELARPGGLEAARHWARRVSLDYRRRQIAAFDGLLAEVDRLRAARRIPQEA